MSRTLRDIQELCSEKQIEVIDFKMTDIDGRWRHLSIPVHRLTEDTLKYGIGFDGSNYGFAAVENSDMVFIPDLDSAAVDTFCSVPTLSMIGDVMVIDSPENRPFDQYPRSVAKKAAEYLKSTGIADRMTVGPEYEFYVFDDVEYENTPSASAYRIEAKQAEWARLWDSHNGGYQVPHHGGYHTVMPLDVNNDLRSRMCLIMEQWGIDVKYDHHEVGGCGQQEIEVELGDMVKMADDTAAAKYIIRNAAAAEGKTATFMPKPVYGEAGNGLHMHMQLFKGDEPVFYDPDGYAQLSDTAMWFIGGLLTHARSLCAITNPSTNSYKRLIPGFEAPVTIGYAMANRSAVVRIPAYAKSPANKRFELRNPDATCNPYYAMAAILMAGLDGIRNRIDPHEKGWGPYDFNLWNLPEEEKAKLGVLPGSLSEALDALEEDHGYLTEGGVFPPELIDLYIRRYRAEEERLSRIPTPAEFAAYYDM